MSKHDAWMPLYVGDYLADTGHLRTIEHGAYLLLIMHYWRTGPLPDDDLALASIARLSAREWKGRVASTLRAFFTAEAARLIHKRIEKERKHAGDVSEKRREAGKAGADVRHGKRDGKTVASATENAAGRVANATVLPADLLWQADRQSQSQSQSQSPEDIKTDSPPDSEAARDVTVAVAQPDPLGTGIVGMTPDPMTGKAMVGGWDVEVVFERCCEAAGINPFMPTETWKTVSGWLNADLDADDIVGVIRRIASRHGTTRAKTLKFFDSAVRADCKPTGMLAKMRAVPDGVGEPGGR